MRQRGVLSIHQISGQSGSSRKSVVFIIITSEKQREQIVRRQVFQRLQIFGTHTSMDTQTYCQCDAFGWFQTRVQVPYRLYNPQPSMNGTLCVFLVGDRIPKVHQEPIAQELSDMPIITLDDFSTRRLIGANDFPVLFRVKLTGELC
jgi:hypothetical protein